MNKFDEIRNKIKDMTDLQEVRDFRANLIGEKFKLKEQFTEEDSKAIRDELMDDMYEYHNLIKFSQVRMGQIVMKNKKV